MRRTRASYHYAVRHVKRNKEQIIRNRIAQALIDNSNRILWSEIRKIRNNKKSDGCTVVDVISDGGRIAELFATKYSDLYNSVCYNRNDLQDIMFDVENNIQGSSICIMIVLLPLVMFSMP